MKHVVMFSSGAGSAGAAKRVADRYGTSDLTLLFADVNGEHGDNYRFLREAVEWIGGQLVVLDNDGRTIWQVFAQRRFLGNTRVDPCSRVLKREATRHWIEEHCEPEHSVIYFGYDWTEEHRLDRAKPHWRPWRIEAPLTWQPVMDKGDVLAMFEQAGIEPPWLTRMGMPHANCGGGCVKAGVKHFLRLLALDPAEYAKWEWNERRLRDQLGDVAILRDRKGGRTRPLTLRELREVNTVQGVLFDYGGAEDDWGGCNCMTPAEDDPR
jgi:hypothetical protein